MTRIQSGKKVEELEEEILPKANRHITSHHITNK
jgi:hypothetical protein